MEDSKRLQEDLFHRQLWSGPGCFPSLKWCQESGTVALMTQNTVQLRSYQYKYMASFKASWLSVEKGGPVTGIAPYVYGEGPAASLSDWFHRNATKEGVGIQFIAWSKDIRERVCNHPMLIVLLTDGMLMLVDVVNGTRADIGSETLLTGRSTHVVSFGFQVRFQGIVLALDCTDAWKAIAPTLGDAEQGANRIRCFAEHSFAETGVTVLVLASAHRVSLWQVKHATEPSSSSTPSAKLSIHRLFEAPVASIGASDAIASLLVCSEQTSTSEARSSGAKEKIIVVAASTSAGDVHLLRFAVTVGAPSSMLGTVAGAQVQMRCTGMQRVHVCDTPITDMQLLPAPSIAGGTDGTAAGPSNRAVLTAVSCGALYSLPLDTLLADFSRNNATTAPSSSSGTPLPSVSAVVLHKGNVVAVVPLPAVHTGHEHAVRTVTASTDGELSVWASDHSPTALAWSQVAPLPSRSANYPVLGVDTDCAGLMFAYLYKTPGQHINSREVQLNNALRFPRCAVAWELSPFVAEDVASSARSVAEVFLHVVALHTHQARNGASSVQGSGALCLAALPLAFLRSLECDTVKQYYRSKIQDLKLVPLAVPSTGSAIMRGTSGRFASTNKAEGTGLKEEGSAAGDITSDSEYEGTEEAGNADTKDSDSEADGSKDGGSRGTGADVKLNKFSTPARKRKRVSNMSAVYERIEQLERPSKAEAVTLSVGTLFDAAVMAVKCLATARVRSGGTSSSFATSTSPGSANGFNGTGTRLNCTTDATNSARVLIDEDICDAVEERWDLDEKIAALFSLPEDCCQGECEYCGGPTVWWRGVCNLLCTREIGGVRYSGMCPLPLRPSLLSEPAFVVCGP
jgi:hypothetical protein